MSKLDSLKISECPFAFASFAAKHNALVDMLAGMVGENGISVVMAEKNAIIRANIAGGGTLGNVTGTMANVVGSDGRLQNVYAGTAIANAYPSYLQVGDPSPGYRTQIDAGSVLAWDSSVGTYAKISVDDGLQIRDGVSFSLSIPPSAITANMGVREIDVCVSNVAMKMLVIASAPY